MTTPTTTSRPPVEYSPSLPIGPLPPCFPTDRTHLEPAFNPAQHLQLRQPKDCTLLDFSQVPPDAVPVARAGEASNLAFTSGMSVLSDDGVAAMRQVLDNHREIQSSNTRINRYVRGMAYSSKWVRDFAESREVVSHLSRLAGMPLVPHYFHASYAHTNLSSDPSMAKVVDSWHVDSCPFVLIIVCSDMTDMEGGTLQAVKRRGQRASEALVRSTNNNVDSKDMMEAHYVSRGWGIFMQGSELLHRVTPVRKAREARISVVNSYMPANVMYIDRTAPGSYLGGIDGKSPFPEAAFEFLRGRSWRAMHQLRHYVNQPFTEDRAKMAEQLEMTVAELQQVIDVLRGRRVEFLGYLQESDGGKLADTTSAGDKKKKQSAGGNTADGNVSAKTDHPPATSGIASAPRLAPSKL